MVEITRGALAQWASEVVEKTWVSDLLKILGVHWPDRPVKYLKLLEVHWPNASKVVKKTRGALAQSQ